MSVAPDVVIVGGGIWGASTAFHLVRESNLRVLVLERNFDLAQETTINAAGMVGQIRTSAVMTKAIGYALQLFEQFPAEYGHDPGLVRCGSLFLGITPARIEFFARQIQAGRANGLTVDKVGQRDLDTYLRGLDSSKILGGYFVHGDGYVDPIRSARALAAAAVDRRAEFRFGVKVSGLRIEKGRATGVETTAGFVPAGSVIVAAGPWTGLIARMVGFEVPVFPIRHQRIRTTAWPKRPPDHPVLRLPDLSSYVRPDGQCLVCGHFEPDPMAMDICKLRSEFHTCDIEPPVSLMAKAQQEVAKFYPQVGKLDVAEHRRGLVTLAPDGAYALGPHPEVPNLFLASGCAALGIAGSAAVGKWLAEWLIDGAPREDVSEFSLSRFGDIANDRPRIRDAAVTAYANYYSIRE